MPRFFPVWPVGIHSYQLLFFLLTYSNHSWRISLFSVTTRFSILILCFPCFSSGISHFSKELFNGLSFSEGWQLVSKIWPHSIFIATGISHSRTFQPPELGHVCVCIDTHMYTNIYNFCVHTFFRNGLIPILPMPVQHLRFLLGSFLSMFVHPFLDSEKPGSKYFRYIWLFAQLIKAFVQCHHSHKHSGCLFHLPLCSPSYCPISLAAWACCHRHWTAPSLTHHPISLDTRHIATDDDTEPHILIALLPQKLTSQSWET